MSSKSIHSVAALEMLDSRGNPTVQCRVELADGTTARASVPSGASTGQHEAQELRDNDAGRYRGQGVQQAIENIHAKIGPALKGQAIDDLSKIDRMMIELDGTEAKSHLGANAILAVSLACARLAAQASKLPVYQYIRQKFGYSSRQLTLPRPMFNIINGGQHSDDGLDIQEYMIMPQAEAFHERLRIASEVFHALGSVLKKRKHSIAVSDEGGYGPRLKSNTEPFELIIDAVRQAGFKMGKDVTLALDAAASTFYHADSDQYQMVLDQKTFSTESLIDLYSQWIDQYYIQSIEDGLREDDWDGWQKLTNRLGSQAMIVGDDLFVTNSQRLQQGIQKSAANAIIIKPNQIGTLTETIECIKLAQANRYKIVIAHRSGETIDDFIADLSVGVSAEYIKAGSVCRGERLAKYNRLLEIEMALSE